MVHIDPIPLPNPEPDAQQQPPAQKPAQAPQQQAEQQARDQQDGYALVDPSDEDRCCDCWPFRFRCG